MRSLLIFNPNATTTDVAVRDRIAALLAAEVDLEVLPTKQRGHATHLVAGAVHEGVEAVFALGGDGTANEVIQALAATPVMLGVIPGGGANVLARALGLPNDAEAATRRMLGILRERGPRRINLGRAGQRYFGFNAGFGWDAAVVQMVERHVRLKRTIRQGSFVASAVREWFTGDDHRDPSVYARVGGEAARGPYTISIIGNTDPYTYLGRNALHLTPQASFSRGLDLLAVDATSTFGLLAIILGAFRGGRHLSRRDIDYLSDLEEFTLTSRRPRPLMVDGDYAGMHTSVTFTSAPSALSVIA